MSTLQQNLQRPFYIKNLLERLRYGKAAVAMRREAADLIEKMNEDSSNLSAQNSYQAMRIEELQRDLAAAQEALAKINAIRNSIIGFQKPNWSEHVYPLVAALEAAGIKGEPYPEARGKAQTLLDELKEAQEARERAEARVKSLVLDLSAAIGRYQRAEERAAQNELDAERYRKARRNGGFFFSSDCMTDEEIDAKIDALTDYNAVDAAREPK